MNKEIVLQGLPLAALLLVTVGMIVAILGVTTTGLFLPGIYAITLGFVFAAAAAIVSAIRARNA